MSADISAEAEAIAEDHRWRPARFMVICAHPDDPDFGPAGTASRWIDAGSRGWLVCCTSGDQGSEDPSLDPLALARVREREQRRAAEIVGYEGVSFLHQPDGALVNDLALRELLVREIRTFRPDAVLTHDPEVIFHPRGGVNHTDHRAAGIAAADAVYPAARNPMAFPWLVRDGFAPHRVRRIYLFWPAVSEARIDISATLDRKIEALLAHESQLRDREGIDRRLRDWASAEGKAIGVEAAESFRVVIIDQDPAEEQVSPETPATDA